MLPCSRVGVTIFWQPGTWVLITLMGTSTMSVGAPYALLVVQHLGLDNTDVFYHPDYGCPYILAPEIGREKRMGCTLIAHLHIMDICLIAGCANHIGVRSRGYWSHWRPVRRWRGPGRLVPSAWLGLACWASLSSVTWPCTVGFLLQAYPVA